MSDKDLPDTNILVSSANNIYDRFSDILEMSLTYNKNNKGPNMDHCGTPIETLPIFEFSLL